MRKQRVLALCLLSIALIAGCNGCRHTVNSNNPAVVQTAALLDASNTSKTFEDGLTAANMAIEKLQTAEPDYYTHVKPLLRKLSSANVVVAQKIEIVKNGGTADWQGAFVVLGTSVTPNDLTTFGFKNPNSQALVSGGFALLIATLEAIQGKYGTGGTK